jgi:hypothetical protein
VNYETIELDTDRCYFPDNIYDDDDVDSDDSDFSEKVNHLIVTYKPRILYENSQWKNEKIYNKYEQIIKNNKYDLSNIKSIIKEEVRYLR